MINEKFTTQIVSKTEANGSIPKNKIPPYKVFLNWEIHHICNYKCSYCPASKHEEFIKEIYLPIKKLAAHWECIYKKYGSTHIQISGGEPSIYPDFFGFLQNLSCIHTVEIITNLSFDLNMIINKISNKRLRIGASFHPEFASFNEFMAKVKEIRDANFEVWVNYVAYPELMQKMEYYKNEFSAAGIRFTIIPYSGKYKNRIYPKDYSEEELSFLKDHHEKSGENRKQSYRANLIEKITDVSDDLKKKICRMGQMYAKIYPGGNAYRCCATKSLNLGNIFNDSFTLLEEPLPCDSDECLCWRCMVIGEEDRWGKHWSTINPECS